MAETFIYSGFQSCFAEKEGFEPSVPIKSTTVFETAPFDHSGISPNRVQNYTVFIQLQIFLGAIFVVCNFRTYK